MAMFSQRTTRLVLSIVWLLTMSAAFLAGVFAYRHRAQIRAFMQPVHEGNIVQTNLYNLRVETVSTPGVGRYGGIEAIADGILLSSGDGRLWYVDSTKTLNPLGLRVPINVTEFESDPYNTNTATRENFAVKDLFIENRPGGIRIFASHNYWHGERECNTLRVSAIELTADELLAGGVGKEDEWTTVYDSNPCRELSLRANGGRGVSIGAGGRMAVLPDGALLVTLGGFGSEAETPGPSHAQNPESDYSKTVRVDLTTGETRVFTMGHRNPQGLAVAADSVIWLTEHGSRGGDELNHITEGLNYGYPFVSYGTYYEAMRWDDNPRQSHHEGYEPATFAWVPSIGISQLVVMKGTAFPHWREDLLVSSLAGQSVYRVSVQYGRAAFAEPILVEHRIRDIVEANDGTIVLKTDDNFLIYLSPVDPADASLEPAERGAIIATQCQGCHTTERGGSSGIGPNLWNVAGRQIASVGGFNYSEALRSVEGRWDRDALRSFLASPDSFAPGTSMLMATNYDEAQIADLIEYLETLR